MNSSLEKVSFKLRTKLRKSRTNGWSKRIKKSRSSNRRNEGMKDSSEQEKTGSLRFGDEELPLSAFQPN